MSARVALLEDELKQLKLNSTAPQTTAHPPNESLTAVIGNIPGVKGSGPEEFGKASDCLLDRCRSRGIAIPSRVHPEAKFEGILFAKCISIEARNKLIESIKQVTRATFSSAPDVRNLFAKIEQPIDVRLAQQTFSESSQLGPRLPHVPISSQPFVSLEKSDQP